MPRTLTLDVLVTPDERRRAMERDVRAGLERRPRSIPPVWFYDEVGSRLFDEITRLPEYYLTRAERSILEAHAAELAAASGAVAVVEIGSGTSEKTRIILDALAAAGQLRSLTLLDISEEILGQAATDLGDRYDVPVRAVVGDLRTDLARVNPPDRSLWAFLGSTIGNFEPVSRHRLLRDFRAAMGPGDSLLLGTDLRKRPERLVAAYDDASGITGAFNLNVLTVLNRDLGADFDPALYRHRAVWNEAEGWIEMRLGAEVAHRVAIASLDLEFEMAAGEEILTEISAKFDRDAIPVELAEAGLAVRRAWTDPDGDFLLSLAAPS